MTASLWPLLEEFPGLAALPRAALRTTVTPVEPLSDISPRLWIKRDDLSARPIGGNKVRALEFLLGAVQPESLVYTAGSRGSTHVLTTAIHAKDLGIRIKAGSWPQEMNDVARLVDARLSSEATRRHFGSPVTAALWLKWHEWRGDRTIPPGGTSPLGILGHVNAAMELAGQVRSGLLPRPARVVVPLGTGGTAAGLALGFWLAGMSTVVVGARVVPKIVGRSSRIDGLIQGTVALIERCCRLALAFKGRPGIDVVEGVYGGAYARPLPRAAEIARQLPPAIVVDPTYSAKALVAALESARDADTLFWLTFDSRWIASR